MRSRGRLRDEESALVGRPEQILRYAQSLPRARSHLSDAKEQILRCAQDDREERGDDREDEFVFPVNFWISAAMRRRASALNQKSRKGSSCRAASKRVTASARARRLTSA